MIHKLSVATLLVFITVATCLPGNSYDSTTVASTTANVDYNVDVNINKNSWLPWWSLGYNAGGLYGGQGNGFYGGLGNGFYGGLYNGFYGGLANGVYGNNGLNGLNGYGSLGLGYTSPINGYGTASGVGVSINGVNGNAGLGNRLYGDLGYGNNLLGLGNGLLGNGLLGLGYTSPVNGYGSASGFGVSVNGVNGITGLGNRLNGGLVNAVYGNSLLGLGNGLLGNGLLGNGLLGLRYTSPINGYGSTSGLGVSINGVNGNTGLLGRGVYDGILGVRGLLGGLYHPLANYYRGVSNGLNGNDLVIDNHPFVNILNGFPIPVPVKNVEIDVTTDSTTKTSKY